MGIEDFIKEYTTLILWISSIATGLYIFGDGKVLSWDIKQYAMGKYIMIGLIILNLYIAIKLYKALIAEKAKEPKVIYKEAPKNQVQESKPFDFRAKTEEVIK